MTDEVQADGEECPSRLENNSKPAPQTLKYRFAIQPTERWMSDKGMFFFFYTTTIFFVLDFIDK